MTVVVTHFPSPYQVELFNEIERQEPGWLKVLYLFRRDPARSWKSVAANHAHEYLDRSAVPPSISDEIVRAEFVVFNYFNDGRVAKLIRERNRTGMPWCFWGERPGYRYPWLARLNRLGRLAPLRNGQQPIWGIGRWAVEAYRREYGSQRSYLNLPYFSDLERFQRSRPSYAADHFTFLFSGAITHRKGVDVLSRAFARLAAETTRARLTIMGVGDLIPTVRRLLPDERVEWLGFRDWDHLPDVYSRAHALCVPSRHDGWGLVVTEGLAAGLPTISTDRTGAALDLIRTGQNGWLVPANDESALYQAMRNAVALEPHTWKAMSDQARASVREHSLADGARRFVAGVRDAMQSASASQ